MPLVVLGLNHKTAPISLREAFAIPGDELAHVVRRVVAEPGVAEAFVVSTCNRVEIYALADHDDHELRARVGACLGDSRALDPATLERHGYAHAGDDAIRHLMRVCASLDSLVVGEAQILAQVREAVAVAREAGTIGPVLDRILQVTLRAAKAVRTQTGIARNTVSIGSVAVDLARRIFPSLPETRVLVIGAGKMGRLTAKALAAAGVHRVYITNRSPQRAFELAAEHGWHARDQAELDDLLTEVDVVITATGAARPILDRTRMKPLVKRRKYRPLFLVDIALPRDVDPAVGELESVYLYNIDDLEQISAENRARRHAEVGAAETILAAAIADLEGWQRGQRVKPTLAAIRHHADDVLHAELDRVFRKQLSGLSEAERDAVRAATAAVINKLLHPALATLREHAGSTREGELANAARALFGLGQGEGEGDGDGSAAEAPSAPQTTKETP
ncbi:MAG: glutamyl-tRNA reductase [Myxococcales bacterium]|nr:glutamyl-tRNA reductase [Myxococcales bacterium]MCB9736750.1 glutamyl-tRNA reductase [Deltaproteobacteria bacterium]